MCACFLTRRRSWYRYRRYERCRLLPSHQLVNDVRGLVPFIWRLFIYFLMELVLIVNNLGFQLRAVFMGIKICTKIFMFLTRSSCEYFAVEDFVTVFMGRKCCSWGNASIGHGFDKVV